MRPTLGQNFFSFRCGSGYTAFSRVAVPFALAVAQDDVHLRVRRHFEDVALSGLLALLDLADLLTDADERVDEAVELLLALALRRLNHERVAHGPAHRRRVEAVVLEALGDIDRLDARRRAERPRVEDELVRAPAVLVGVEDLVVRLEAREDVVGVEDGRLGREAQAVVAHERVVRPADGQNAGAAVRRAGHHGLPGLGRAAGQVRAEVLLDADGSNTGTAAAVRDAEGLVEVEMADVGPDLARRADADLGVHVGAVHVHLTTVLVNEVAGLLDTGLEDSVGAGVRDHEGTELVGVLLALGFQVLNVQVTRLLVALDGDDAHAGHGGRGRVGAVGRDRDQADVTLLARLLLEVLADDAQAGELALGARVGLQGDGVHGGDALELLRQAVDQGRVALELAHGRVGVDRGEAGEGDERHLGRAVQLHGAGSERDHGVDEGQVLGLEVMDVAEDLRLTAVGVEDGVGEVGRLATERLGQQFRNVLGEGAVGLARDLGGLGAGGFAEDGGDGVEDFLVDRLVNTDANITVSIVAEAQTSLLSLGQDVLGAIASLDHDSVEQNLAVGAGTALLSLQAGGLGDGLDAASKPDQSRGDLLEPLGAVVDGEQRSHVGQKSLCGADVAGGLLTADVLLAGLQSQSQGPAAAADIRGKNLGNKLINGVGGRVKRLEHGLGVMDVRADVAGDERLGPLERFKGGVNRGDPRARGVLEGCDGAEGPHTGDPRGHGQVGGA
ncbi:putative metal-dependent RNase [Colletotrichum higginsianum]|nr:putative metal-dependent RNase [Colletotrichum higginsianum]